MHARLVCAIEFLESFVACCMETALSGSGVSAAAEQESR